MDKFNFRRHRLYFYTPQSEWQLWEIDSLYSLVNANFAHTCVSKHYAVVFAQSNEARC